MNEVMIKIVELAEALGVAPMNQHQGCWEHQVSEGWRIAVNGHREPKEMSTGVTVPPFTAAVAWYGFPAGFITPRNGVIAAGSEANEDTLITALSDAIEAA